MLPFQNSFAFWRKSKQSTSFQIPCQGINTLKALASETFLLEKQKTAILTLFRAAIKKRIEVRPLF
jgi:hypothetical protein